MAKNIRKKKIKSSDLYVLPQHMTSQTNTSFGVRVLRKGIVKVQVEPPRQDTPADDQATKESLKQKAQIIRRITKQARYSSLQTLTMKLLKRQSLYNQVQQIARVNQLPFHKSYSVVVLRLGFYLHEKLTKEQSSSLEEIVEEIFNQFQSDLQKCLIKKYRETNKPIFLQMVREKNKSDLNVLKRLLLQSPKNFNKILHIIRDLYEKRDNKKRGIEPSKLAKKVADIYLRARIMGRRMNFESNIKHILSQYCEQESAPAEVQKQMVKEEYIEGSIMHIKNWSSADIYQNKLNQQ